LYLRVFFLSKILVFVDYPVCKLIRSYVDLTWFHQIWFNHNVYSARMFWIELLKWVGFSHTICLFGHRTIDTHLSPTKSEGGGASDGIIVMIHNGLFIVLSEVKTTKPVKQILFFWLDSSILPIQPEPYPMITIAIEMPHAHCFPYSPQAHSVLPCFSGVSTAAKPGGEWPVTKAAQVYTLVPRNPEPQVQPLQPGLCRVRSQTSGRYYYYDPCTGVSNWNPWWAAPWHAISVKRFAAYGWVLNHSLDVPSHFCWLNIPPSPRSRTLLRLPEFSFCVTLVHLLLLMSL